MQSVPMHGGPTQGGPMQRGAMQSVPMHGGPMRSVPMQGGLVQYIQDGQATPLDDGFECADDFFEMDTCNFARTPTMGQLSRGNLDFQQLVHNGQQQYPAANYQPPGTDNYHPSPTSSSSKHNAHSANHHSSSHPNRTVSKRTEVTNGVTKTITTEKIVDADGRRTVITRESIRS